MWFIDGRRNFTGPRDIDGLLQLARRGLQKGEYVEDVVADKHGYAAKVEPAYGADPAYGGDRQMHGQPDYTGFTEGKTHVA
jgi:hypothetical protein